MAYKRYVLNRASIELCRWANNPDIWRLTYEADSVLNWFCKMPTSRFIEYPPSFSKAKELISALKATGAYKRVKKL